MSVFEKLRKAMQDHNVDAYIAQMADDCTFVRHQTGQIMNRDEIAAMLTKMLAPGGATFGEPRCIYENDDILVVHAINEYPDGTREAVLGAYSLKDGKVTRVETGATPL
ncbi:MAG: nuclear transport factor 2 family protein [Rhodobacteraceae bacterium]|nr:nuclear transport factor 2 family protein [Paracoccaceae bacterium]